MKIYVDMDGVLCDFEKQFSKLAGIPKSEVEDYKDEDMWDLIIKEGEKYWSDMDWQPGGKELWEFLKDKNPTILSSPIDHESCITGKKKWIKEHLGNVPVILDSDKYKYAEPGSILIDDMEKNIDPWNDKKGVGVLHKSSKDTIKFLKEMLKDEAAGNLPEQIDKIASILESKGLIKEAHDLDIIANTLEAFQNRPVKIRPYSDVVQMAVRELGPALKNVDAIVLENSCAGDKLAWVSNQDFLKGKPGEQRVIHLCLKKIEDRFKKTHNENFTPNDPQDYRQMKNVIVQYLQDVILPHETEHIHQEMEHGGEFGHSAEPGAERQENWKNLEQMGITKK